MKRRKLVDPRVRYKGLPNLSAEGGSGANLRRVDGVTFEG